MDEGTQQNTLRNSRNLQSNTTSVGTTPANPFKKTFASLGTENRPNPVNRGSEGRSMELGSKTTRPHYDVEDFKKLLLTGERSGSEVNAAVPPAVSFQSATYDSSSNTDASSISRHSIFEPVSGPVHESPRTSHESVLSDDERQRLVGDISIASEKNKPLTPRHRHGKLVKTNAPQTVSFEDPTISFSESAMTSMAPVGESMPEISSKGDKPLPPLPSLLKTQSSPQDRIKSTDNEIRGLYLASEESRSSDTAQKRSPPPPPLSRRHSQLRERYLASNLERSTPITEEVAAESASSQTPPIVDSKAPPPPPPRRAGLVRGQSSTLVSTGASSTPISDQSSTHEVSTRSAKPRPPVPVNRSPTVLSVQRPDQTESIPVSSPIAPPPPPPRRRGSSQSSYTPSQLSGHYTERIRSDSGASSISHLAMTPVSPSGDGKKDVMADLSALQREVDELRGKFKD